MIRLVMPHQLFATHLDAPDGTRFILVEHDLFFRQYRFHRQKLVLHRASMSRFATRLSERGFDVEVVESDGRTTSRAALARALTRFGGNNIHATDIHLYDVVDDWLCRDVLGALADAGVSMTPDDMIESPNFLTTRAQLREAFDGGRGRPRMATFYTWQRRRLGVLLDADGEPVGGQWSFDADNRKKLPRNHPVPAPLPPERDRSVDDAIDWVVQRFPDNPGEVTDFRWPTSHAEAEASFEQFLSDRFSEFGPYEDALSAEHPYVFHSLLTPALNIGLISPRTVLNRAIEVGERNRVPLPSIEGFVRQVIGWREYMRATYHLYGRRLRSRNHLAHHATPPDGWWTAQTGLEPVDLVLRRVLDTGYAHHIERLMVLGNAMCLLRVHPDAVYEWFMEMFVDAYDWVMVPNVYAMGQFAAGTAITTKPYVSGSNYLRTMSDYPGGDWIQDWDALYWTFVRDHRDVFEANPRSRMMPRTYDRLPAETKAAHTRRAATWLN